MGGKIAHVEQMVKDIAEAYDSGCLAFVVREFDAAKGDVSLFDYLCHSLREAGYGLVLEFLEEYSLCSLPIDVWEAAFRENIPFDIVYDSYRGAYFSEYDFADEMLAELRDAVGQDAWDTVLPAISREHYWDNLSYDFRFICGHVFFAGV